MNAFVFLVPALQVGVGSAVLAKYLRFMRAARRVEATTIEPASYPEDGGTEIYRTRFEYRVDGVRYEGEVDDDSASRHWRRAGRKLTVYYLAASPERGRLARRIVPTVAVIVVLLGLAVGTMLVAVMLHDAG